MTAQSNLAILLLAGALGAGVGGAEAAAPDGAAVFESRCARCHGESGKTDTASGRVLKVRPLVDDAQLARMAPADIVKAMRSDVKHQDVGALKGIDDAELEAVAVFVNELAKKH